MDSTQKSRPPIEMHSVQSSQINCVGYDEATKTLAVQFRHGAKAFYHYPNVKPETYVAFMAAESKGVFFKEHIKALPFEKFPAEPQPEQNDVQAAAGGTTQTAVEA